MTLDVKHKRSLAKIHIHALAYRAQPHCGEHPSNELHVTKGTAEGSAIFREKRVVFYEVQAAPDHVARREGGPVRNPRATLVVYVPVISVVAIRQQLPSFESKERRKISRSTLQKREWHICHRAVSALQDRK